MESNKVLETLRDICIKEIEELTKKGTLSPTEADAAKNTVCIIKEIDEIVRRTSWNDETSGCHDRYMYPPYDYSYGPGRMYSYDHGDTHSMARGRNPMTGRYVSRGDMTSGRRMYGTFSYDGTSGHSIEDRVIDKIEGMMDGAQSNYERDRLNQFIRVIDSMKGE